MLANTECLDSTFYERLGYTIAAGYSQTKWNTLKIIILTRNKSKTLHYTLCTKQKSLIL